MFLQTTTKTAERTAAEEGGIAAEAHSLDNIELLGSLSAQERSKVAALCFWKPARRGKCIPLHNGHGRHVMFVIEGVAMLVSHAANGREIFLAAARTGGCLFETPMEDRRRATSRVEVLEDSLVALLPVPAFTALVKSKPEVAHELVRTLEEMLVTNNKHIEALTTQGTQQRICHMLLQRAEPNPVHTGSYIIRQLPTQNHLAIMAGTTRETVARVSVVLHRDGIIGKRRRGGVLLIRDLGGLAERANTTLRMHQHFGSG